jgi:glycosyltransferase involved in cell wall biosynthesis
VAEHLTIVTPWYPSRSKPFGGAFVRSQALALQGHVGGIDVIHLDEWPLPAGARVQSRIREDALRLLRGPARPRSVARAEGDVLRVPVPVVPRSAYELAAEHAVEALQAVLPTGRIEADVVHAHVGLPAGLAAVRCARPGAKVIVTEHATFLDRMIATPDGRAAYAEVLEGCSAFVAVSQLLRDQLVAEFPDHAGKVVVIPNVVPFERIPVRPRPVESPRRWLYLGSFQERKGVRHLLEAFAVCHLDDPTIELTMVGGGPQQSLLRERVTELGLEGAVRVEGPVGPDEVYDLYHAHDLLVHASRYETFGMTIIEALASGMAVLVTRCGGPEETLAGVEDRAGALVDVGDGVIELVQGYRDLVARFDQLDLPAVREVLAGRYGLESVGTQLRDLYATA